MIKISPFLWFDSQAEEAARFYTSIFKNSSIDQITRYGENMPLPAGSVMTIAFHLDGQELTALNGGPEFKFNEAISFYILCDTQDEVDYYWDKLTTGGEESVCGWLKDKYGLSWQVVPRRLIELMNDEDREKAQRVTEAMLKMKKIDLRVLEEAYMMA